MGERSLFYWARNIPAKEQPGNEPHGEMGCLFLPHDTGGGTGGHCPIRTRNLGSNGGGRCVQKTEKFRRDQHAQISFAENKGRLQEKTELAQKLISLGVSIDIITEATGFSKDQLNAIQAKN